MRVGPSRPVPLAPRYHRAMTSLRAWSLSLLSAVVLLPGCPGEGGDDDAGPEIITSCDGVDPSISLGAPCSFTEECTDFCGDVTFCGEGRLMRTMRKPCFDVGVPDGGTDAGEAELDAGDVDAGDDAGACAPDETASSCRADEDCGAAFEQCLAPGEFGGCGICMVPEALCASDADCEDGDICFTYRPLCSCGGDASECRPRCTDGSCDEDESCDASSGRCAPTACTAGYLCPAHTACAPSSERADAHGCERATCEADSDCACGGGCVDGACYDALGMCSPIPA